MTKGKPPKRRSPAEKKALSYAKDRRNSFGENDKASRKAIPARKAAENRKVRRNSAQILGNVSKLDEEAADTVESSLRHDTKRVGGWKKAPDMPLGEIVEHAKSARAQRAGRKILPKWESS